MKKLYILTVILFTTVTSFGQTIFYEGFNYTSPGNVGGSLATASDAIGSNNWATHSNTATTGTGTVDVLSGTLSYNGIAPSTGNKVLLPASRTTTPRDINRGFSTTATTIYYSFLINVLDATQLTAAPITSTDNYFISLGSSSGNAVTSLFGRVSITSSNAGANYRLHISNTSTGTLTYTENPVDLNFGTTNLVVVKYDRSSNPTVATFWVNPTSLGGAEPASTLTNSAGTATVIAFASVCLRNSTATPKAEIDEIKVGLTYADVTSLVLSNNQFNEIAGFSMYPNPVSNGKLFISSDNNIEKTVAIYDLIGKEIINQTVTNELNISSLTAGVYVVKVTEEGKTATRKLIVR